MIINENLLLGYGNHNNTAHVLDYTTSAIAPIKKGEKYTISYIVENSNRFGVYTDTLSDGIFEPYTDVTEVINRGERKKGDTSTPYIPSKNMIKSSKQAIFVAGGVLQGSISSLSCLGVGYVS